MYLHFAHTHAPKVTFTKASLSPTRSTLRAITRNPANLSVLPPEGAAKVSGVPANCGGVTSDHTKGLAVGLKPVLRNKSLLLPTSTNL